MYTSYITVFDLYKSFFVTVFLIQYKYTICIYEKYFKNHSNLRKYGIQF